MIKLGLTGSIGMGKSTTAQMFRDRNVPVWDADAAVHHLYAANGAGSRALEAVYPEAVGPEGVDRAVLRDVIAEDPQALKRIEGLIHPLLRSERAAFVNTNSKEHVVLFDIPLLFETGADAWLDRIAVVSTDAERQKARVLDRPNMDAAHFEFILSKQVPDAEKRARADFVIDTTTLESAASGVDHILSTLREASDA
ncbi:dephospho-CoA kinase [Tropicimonas sp. S265A]|uniref:dephospho-CoA kinase n=1 Tax=Tropicimonas sp. S265A TaxID=3415134 RepID=UPI003C7A7E21